MTRLLVLCLCCLLILGLAGTACAASTPTSLTVPLADYPLKPGNTWTYLVGRYDGFNPSEIATSTYVMTETVAAVTTDSSYYIATMRQEVSREFPIYVPASMEDLPHGAPTPEQYWLVIDGNRLYRQWMGLDTGERSLS